VKKIKHKPMIKVRELWARKEILWKLKNLQIDLINRKAQEDLLFSKICYFRKVYQ